MRHFHHFHLKSVQSKSTTNNPLTRVMTILIFFLYFYVCMNTNRAAHDLITESNTFSFSLKTAFRLFLIMRCASGLYSVIQDCDEVFNYWEPVHYLLEGYGFQTWEYSPRYSIRSWAYVFVYAFFGFFAQLISSTKVKANIGRGNSLNIYLLSHFCIISFKSFICCDY